MTLREICESLGVSRRTLQGYEKAGLVASTGRNKYGICFMMKKPGKELQK